MFIEEISHTHLNTNRLNDTVNGLLFTEISQSFIRNISSDYRYTHRHKANRPKHITSMEQINNNNIHCVREKKETKMFFLYSDNSDKIWYIIF